MSRAARRRDDPGRRPTLADVPEPLRKFDPAGWPGGREEWTRARGAWERANNASIKVLLIAELRADVFRATRGTYGSPPAEDDE